MSGIHASPLYAGGGVAGTVNVPDDSIEFGTLKAVWQLGADGLIYKNDVWQYAWITPQSGMDQFEIRVDRRPGADAFDDNPGEGVWLSAVISPEWGYRGEGTEKGGTFDVQVRRASDAVVVDTAVIYLHKDGVRGTGGGLTGGGGGGTGFGGGEIP